MLPGNESDGGVSPVTLSADWSRVARLLLLASMAVVGCVGNVFMISSVMIEDYLRKRGNAFVVNVALADLLVTGLVVPASCVVLLAGLPESQPVCRFQWALGALCCLVSLQSLAAAAAENYARLCLARESYNRLTPAKITASLVAFWVCSGGAVGLQWALDVGPHYCAPGLLRGGLFPLQAALAAALAALTFLCYGSLALRVREVRRRPSFRPPAAFAWDLALMRTNLYSSVLFVVFWLPFGLTLGVANVRHIPDRLVVNLAWFALSKSCVNSLLYCAANRHFRNAYVNLFHYCCCKTTVAFSRRQRGDGSRPSGDVRVHIIPGYNMYSYTSPQRARELCKSASSNGRDIYEL